MNILVTGANGFIGRAVCQTLSAAGHTVFALVRSSRAFFSGLPCVASRSPYCSYCLRARSLCNLTEKCSSAAPVQREARIAYIHAQTDFVDIEDAIMPRVRVAPLETVVHLAARVHETSENTPRFRAACHETNVAGTLRVAAAAARAGARRFIFVSSIKALGEIEPGRPWREDDSPAPSDPYGHSKYAAEVALRAACQRTGLEMVIVRPPLVYGPEVRANFLKWMRAIARGWPLPLAQLRAPRSFIYLENLANALAVCATHPAAAGRTFHVSDGRDISVAELSIALGEALGAPAHLWRCPVALFSALGRITGRGAQINRLIQPLRLDIERARTVLGWSPPYSPHQGLQQTAAWYRRFEQPRGSAQRPLPY
ncbi:NAD-dependent epimerase/dehydratase [Candidatus Glomeribacter gigasporarum BEG34]|uniref:NAD-dependent epimerase/dehydratase n=1 Tax=Candidatus Glomeribacter gigasporarum BEG34 TaxID=1070319 RepID=G2J7Z3_9BURK|nr:NAD-dependent epimerase/dehydratase family protein [Candidatus Glomeribacter gigasporarum]CCD28890.1 NAD-dependent epimerase/dehydratase [Candidatus Glomeribacter gigasporarum BEG34]